MDKAFNREIFVKDLKEYARNLINEKKESKEVYELKAFLVAIIEDENITEITGNNLDIVLEKVGKKILLSENEKKELQSGRGISSSKWLTHSYFQMIADIYQVTFELYTAGIDINEYVLKRSALAEPSGVSSKTIRISHINPNSPLNPNKEMWTHFDPVEFNPSKGKNTEVQVQMRNDEALAKKLQKDEYEKNNPVSLVINEPKIDGKQQGNLQPVLTKGGGGCAFHAVLGENITGEYTCRDVREKRQILSEIIKTATNGSEIYRLRKEAIKAFIMGTRQTKLEGFKESIEDYKRFEISEMKRLGYLWNNFECNHLKTHKEIIEWIKKNHTIKTGKPTFRIMFDNCLSRKDNVLQEQIGKFKELQKAFKEYNKQTKAEYNWEQVYAKKEVIAAYCQLIRTPGEWLLPLEIQMIAYAFDIPISFYTKNRDGIPERIAIYNETGTSTLVSVYFNGINHFEQMTYRKSFKSPIIKPVNKHMDTIFRCTLRTLEREIIRDIKKKPRCFISYAWGVKIHESWVIQFKEYLEKTMKEVDISFDKDDNMSAGLISKFTDKIKNRENKIILIGSKRLMEKINCTDKQLCPGCREKGNKSTGHVIQEEIKDIKQRFEEDDKSVLPVIIDGTPKESLPGFLQEVAVFTDFRPFMGGKYYRKDKDESYYENFFRMLRSIYGLEKDTIARSLFNILTKECLEEIKDTDKPPPESIFPGISSRESIKRKPVDYNTGKGAWPKTREEIASFTGELGGYHTSNLKVNKDRKGLYLLSTNPSSFDKEMEKVYTKSNRLPEDNTYLIPTLKIRNPDFIDRPDLLNQIDEAILKKGSVYLTGLGGIGKTETAREYAYQNKQKYDHVCEFKAENEDFLFNSFKGLAEYFGKPTILHKESLKRFVLKEISKRKWLIIYDNAESYSKIESYLPSQEGLTHVLITSRSKCSTFKRGSEITVKSFKEEDAIKCLLKESGKKLEQTGCNKEKAQKLVRRLGYHPLAIVIASACIRMGETFEQDINNIINENDLDTLTLQETFKISLDKVEKDKKDGKKMLGLLCFCAYLPSEIPKFLLGKWVNQTKKNQKDVSEAESLLRKLGKYSLLEDRKPVMVRGNSEGGVYVHRMVQEAIRSINKNQCKENIHSLSLFFENVVSSYENEIDGWEKRHQLLPCMLSLYTHSLNLYHDSTDTKEIKKMIENMENTVAIFRSSEQVMKDHCDKEANRLPNSILPYILLGEYYRKKDKTEKAKEEYQKAWEINKKNNRKSKMIALKLSMVYFELYKNDKKRESLQQADYYFREAEELSITDSDYLNNGFILYKRGQFEEAIKFFKKVQDENNIESRLYLARSYFAIRNIKEAQSEYEQLINLPKETPGLDRAYVGLGYVHTYSDNLDDAIRSYKGALELNERNDYACFELSRLKLLLGNREDWEDKKGKENASRYRKEALNYLKKAKEINQESKYALDGIERIYAIEAIQLAKEKKYGEIIKYIKERVENNQKELGKIRFARLWCLCGRLLSYDPKKPQRFLPFLYMHLL